MVVKKEGDIEKMPRDQLIVQIIDQFQTVGVSKQETKVYLALLRKEGVTAYQISKEASIPSSKIYPTLNKLVERGFVVATLNRPIKYFPQSPQKLLSDLKSEVENRLQSLAHNLESLKISKGGNDLLAWNITGRKDVINQAKDMIESAKANIFIGIWSKELRPLRNNLTKAVSRGVKLRMVAYGPTTYDQGEIYYHRPSDYPYRERGERRFILTTDDQRAIIANFSDQDTDTGLWTENKGLVLLFRDFVIHEIYIAQVEEAYPNEIRELAGNGWEKLRFSFK